MISVIIATKNGEKYIARATQSALSQSVAIENAQDSAKYPGFEIVAISDGSTDKTAEIVREIGAKDPRVKLIKLTENVGPGLARNQAISQSTNAYIALLDDDDLWTNPDKLKNQINYLEEHPEVVLVGAQKTEFTRENGEHLRWIINETDSNNIREHMLAYNPVITSSTVFRKKVFDQVGGFKAMYLAEDYDLWLRMGLQGEISNVQDSETIYTIRNNSASKMKSIEMAKTVLRLVKEYRHLYPNYLKSLAKAYARILLAHWKIIKKGKNPFRTN
jgi:glycosyltransferase involved in cell wall biosynthesis